MGLELRGRLGRGDGRLWEDYRRCADPLYRLPADRRESEFAALHARFFRRLGFEACVARALEDYRQVAGRLAALVLARALHPAEEGADLAPPGPAGAVGVVRLRGERFLSPGDLGRYLDHELLHLADLLDPEFGHEPAVLGEVPPHRRRLVQERYRVAWAISVDGRLSRRGKAPLADPAARRDELGRCLPGLSDLERDRLFESLWGDDRPTHAGLLGVALARGSPAVRQAGAPCPVCGFPTYQWAPDGMGEALIAAIRLDAPRWEPSEGLCGRCWEGYQWACSTRA